MKISKQARRDARDLFRLAQKESVLDEGLVRQIVDELIERKPRGYIGILSQMQRLVKLDIARRTARVESVTPLDEAAQRSIRENLTQRFGPGLQFLFETNPALIGGMRVQVGSDVYDGTVRARLDALQEAF